MAESESPVVVSPRTRRRQLTVFSVAASFNYVAGVLSLVLLVVAGFDFGLAAPFEAILSYYQWLTDRVFGWAEPLLRELLIRASDVLGMHVDLHPHWKHVLILTWLYLGSDAWVERERNRPYSAIFALILGGVVALTVAVGSGTAPIDGRSQLPIVFPVAGFVFYELVRAWEAATFYLPPGKTWGQTFGNLTYRFAFTDALIGLGAVGAGALLAHLAVPSPTLLAFLIFVAALAVRNVIQPAIFVIRSGGPDRWRRYNEFATTQLGFVILRVIGGAILFLLLGAGTYRP